MRAASIAAVLAKTILFLAGCGGPSANSTSDAVRLFSDEPRRMRPSDRERNMDRGITTWYGGIAMLSFEVNELGWSYEFVKGWEKAPADLRHEDVPSVCTDSDDNVFLYCRRDNQVVIYDRDGNFQGRWGAGQFSEMVHSTFMTPDDELYLVDAGGSFVGRFTRDGELLQTIGPRGTASDTGYDGSSFKTVKRGGPPYNRPTAICRSEDGKLFISDGYGNSRVHRFGAAGDLELSWGEPGAEPGLFNLPHGVWVQGDTVFVADRENSRVQLFDKNGELRSVWRDVHRPQDFAQDAEGRIYIAEGAGSVTTASGAPAGRVSVYDPDGNLVCRWRSGDAVDDDDFMLSPHGIWVDSEGSVYATVNAGIGARAYGVEGANPVLKFARV